MRPWLEFSGCSFSSSSHQESLGVQMCAAVDGGRNLLCVYCSAEPLPGGGGSIGGLSCAAGPGEFRAVRGFGFVGGRGNTWDWPLAGKHPAIYQTPSDLGPFLHFPLEFDLWFQVNFKSQGHVVTTFLEGVQFAWEVDVCGRGWRVLGEGLCACACCSCCGCWWWRW